MPSGSTSKVKVIGQKSRSPGQKNGSFACLMSCESRSKVSWVKGRMGQGQSSHGSRPRTGISEPVLDHVTEHERVST